MVDAFSEFSKCVQFIGIERTKEELMKIRLIYFHSNENNINFILNLVINELDIRGEEFFYAKTWNKKRIWAIGMVTFLFSRVLNMSASEISSSLKKSKASCWKNMAAFNNLNEKYEDEKMFLEIYNHKIKPEINKYLKKDTNGNRNNPRKQ
ncbi:MAG: hypothetical protein ACRDE2_00110 [Chitinophagaceae bacterium]